MRTEFATGGLFFHNHRLYAVFFAFLSLFLLLQRACRRILPSCVPLSKKRLLGKTSSRFAYIPNNIHENMLIHPCGHASAHFPHPVHFCGSTAALKFFTLTAPASQTFTQRIQPMQATAHALRASPPLSQFRQRTMACGLAGSKEIRCLGQAVTHWEHARQSAAFTRAKPLQI